MTKESYPISISKYSQLDKLVKEFSETAKQIFKAHGISASQADCCNCCHFVTIRNILIRHEFVARKAAGEKSGDILWDMYYNQNNELSFDRLNHIANEK